jgi:hypothetical protein
MRSCVGDGLFESLCNGASLWVGDSQHARQVRNWYSINEIAKVDRSERTTLPIIMSCMGTSPFNKNGHSMFSFNRRPALMSCKAEINKPRLLMFTVCPIPLITVWPTVRNRTFNWTGKRVLERRSILVISFLASTDLSSCHTQRSKLAATPFRQTTLRIGASVIERTRQASEFFDLPAELRLCNLSRR